MSPARRTVSLISGASAALRQHYIRMVRGDDGAGNVRPGSFWLQTGAGPVAGRPFQPGQTGQTGQPDQALAGGCICCLGGPVFRTTLVRLLRRQDWQHLYLETGQQAEHLLRVIEQLRSPPFNQHLRIVELLQVAAPADGADAPIGDPAALAAAGTGWASITAVAPAVGHGMRQPAAALVPAAGPGQAAGAGWHWIYHDPLLPVAGWRRFLRAAGPQGVSLDDAVAAAGLLWWFCRWPADDGLPARQEVIDGLQPLLAQAGLVLGQAVLQTSRNGYDWRFFQSAGSLSGAAFGPSAANLSPVLRVQETVWRLDNRVMLALAQGTDLAAVKSAVDQLQARWRA